MTEAAEPSPVTVRRPFGRVAGAFLLNLILPPVGYVFVGRWRLALTFLAFVAVLAVSFLAWTFLSPPGIYRWLTEPGSYLALAWSIGLPFAAHAAWIAYREPDARRSSMLIHLAFAAAPLILLGLVRAALPLSVYQIPSVAMNPTLEKGDVLGVVGARAFCGLARPTPGDVVIHRQGRTRYVKRVVAGAGQVVALRNGVLSIDGRVVPRVIEGEALVIDNGPFSLTGKIVRETLPNSRSYRTVDLAPDTEFDNFGPFTVPANAWFALGDNRDNSLDSRANGAVAQKDICGVVVKILKSTAAVRIGARP